MFHANGWGGPFALTAMGATHVVLRAVVGERHLPPDRAGGRHVRLHGARGAAHGPQLSGQGRSTRSRRGRASSSPARRRPRRSSSGSRRSSAGSSSRSTASPRRRRSSPSRRRTSTRREDDYARRSRAGVEAIGVDIQVLDDDGKPVPQDGETIGEVCARSNVVLKGYWEQPEETAKAIYDGYFHSGDLAVWDEFGNIHIVDRKKDVIISGGENISSPEIEDALYKHPAVLECAVIGVPSEKWGETPKALIVLRAGRARRPRRRSSRSRREHLAHFKCPTSVDFVESLPRTATGKLQKFVIREPYWQGVERRVG